MTRRLSQLIKMLMSRQRHPAAASHCSHRSLFPLRRSRRCGSRGRVCPSLCKHRARQNRSGGPGGIRRAAPGRLPVRIPGEAPGGHGKASGGGCLRGEMLILPCVLFHEWINDGQAPWPVDEQRCGSAGKAGSPAAGAVGSEGCSRTPPRPPSLNGNDYPGGD